MGRPVLFEACVDSVGAAVEAAAAGADRVELCSDLLEGGITPSAGLIEQVCLRIQIPVHVLIRPRGGDFCYVDAELAVMQTDIEHARRLGAAAVVFGILDPEGGVDTRRCAVLAERARPLRVTFHRAFDVARDPLGALEQLVELGVDALLTSGQEASALEGAPLLGELVRRAPPGLQIVAAGGVTERNVARLVAATGVPAVHASLRERTDSRMVYRSTRCPMGGALRPPEFGGAALSPTRVRSLLGALGRSALSPAQA
jgi:copper homeostasis protein